MADSRLELRLAHGDGRTRVVEQHHTAPLKVARALPGTVGGQPAAEICVMDASPGLLAGDRYALRFRMEAGSRARITSQGFTRVHPSRDSPASLDVEIVVASGAVLLYLPEAMVLFSEAAIINRLRAEVEPGGVLIGLEMLAAGRIARGECFDFASYKGRLHLRHGGHWTLCAQTVILPREIDPRSPFAWGSYSHWGTLYGVARGRAAQWAEIAREVLANQTRVRAAASLLPHDGLAVGLMAQRAQDAREVALEIVRSWEGSLNFRL